jgi:hypothetical protein
MSHGKKEVGKDTDCRLKLATERLGSPSLSLRDEQRLVDAEGLEPPTPSV